MNAMTENWVPVGTLSDIPRRGARCVRNGDMVIAVFRSVDDRLFALEDRCPHRKGPLSQGIVHGAVVTCPLHNWNISLKSGEALGGDEGCVPTIPLKVDAGRIFLLRDAVIRSEVA